MLLPELVGHNIGRAGDHELYGTWRTAGSSVVSQKPDALLDSFLESTDGMGGVGGQVQGDIAQVLPGK